MEDARLVVFKFLLSFCVCCCFSYQYFSFSERFLIEAYLFKSICQMEIFVTVYLPKECLLNKQSVSLCEVSKTLRIFKKPCFLNCMSFLHNYTQKSNILIKISPMAIAFYYFHIFIIFQLLLGINSTQRVIGCQNRIIKGQAKMN